MAKKKIIKKKSVKKIVKKVKKAVKRKKIVKKVVKKKVAPIEEAPVEVITQPPRGMKDILPADEGVWTMFYNTAASLSRAFGYGYIETPILEYKNLFVRGVGGSTDVVKKEMYCFKDQGGDELCLRPEGTASVVRAYIDHGMLNMPQPVKLWYLGPFFRRERPQAGRYREFHQWGLEVLGDSHPILDAEIISMAMVFFKELKIPVRLEINSIGGRESRRVYMKELGTFYESKHELLCNSCKSRYETNRLRLLDCKEAQCQLLKEGAPEITEFLADEEREHFMRVLEHLDDLDISYNLSPHLVRGLDYYNKTVFEIFEDKEAPNVEGSTKEVALEDASSLSVKKIQEEEIKIEVDGEVKKDIEEEQEEEKSLGKVVALCGGGRYDSLVEELGGRPTPAIGCSLGFERIASVMRRRQIDTDFITKPKIFIAQLGEAARRKSIRLLHELHKKIPVAAAFSKDGLKAQLEVANRLGVRYAVIIGQKEIIDSTAIIRDMEAGIQEVVDYAKLIPAIERKLVDPGL